MLTEQRHEIILNLLSEKGSITVTELKDILNTSESISSLCKISFIDSKVNSSFLFFFISAKTMSEFANSFWV